MVPKPLIPTCNQSARNVRPARHLVAVRDQLLWVPLACVLWRRPWASGGRGAARRCKRPDRSQLFAVRAARRTGPRGSAAPRAFRIEANRPDRQGRPVCDPSAGPLRPGSPARNGPPSTPKAAIGASSAGTGRPTGTKKGRLNQLSAALRELNEDAADRIVAMTRASRVVPLDEATALFAAELARGHGLASLDALIYASALRGAAELVTCDVHFKGLAGVDYRAKGAS